MTDDSNQPGLHDSEAAEVGEDVAALLGGNGDHACPGGDDFAGAETDVVGAEFIGDSGYGRVADRPTRGLLQRLPR